MQKFPAVILHNNKTHAVKRFHPWVFSGAVKKKEDNLNEGDVVEVFSENGEFLCLGHYGTGSISVRVFSFEKISSLNDLWKNKFQNTFLLRKSVGLTESKTTNAYRLINAEGDGMPGLVVDWYNGTAIVQCHSIGMNNEKGNFTEILKEIYREKLKAVYDKSSSSIHSDERQTNSYLYSKSALEDSATILENGHSFKVNWTEGQKTGFFLDQRDNRSLLSNYVYGKKVLNTFCYSGGFSVYAIKGGAGLVHSVDSSSKAIEWANENVKLNSASDNHQSYVSDVFDFLKTSDEEYDIIILDPPAFAKGHSARHSAIKAYTRLNHEALKKIRSGGIVFTFSCSQAVSPDMFLGAVTSAAITSGRNIKVLHHLTQPADHPVSIFNPEGLYLKGLVLYVE